MRSLTLPLLLVLSLSTIAGSATAQEDRVLVFTRTAKFRHDSIPTAVSTLRLLAGRERMAVDQSENPADFTDANLARYRVVVFANTTGDVLDADQQRAGAIGRDRRDHARKMRAKRQREAPRLPRRATDVDRPRRIIDAEVRTVPATCEETVADDVA